MANDAKFHWSEKKIMIKHFLSLRSRKMTLMVKQRELWKYVHFDNSSKLSGEYISMIDMRTRGYTYKYMYNSEKLK